MIWAAPLLSKKQSILQIQLVVRTLKLTWGFNKKRLKFLNTLSWR